MIHKVICVSLVAAFVLLCAEAQAQINFTASVDKNVVALGDTFVLTLTISMSGQGRLPEPELPPLMGFDLISDRATTTGFSMINGVISSSMSRQYVLAPTEEGEFVIGAATLRYGGEIYRTDPIRIQVVAPAQMPERVPTRPENLFATLTADKSEAFLGEQVNLYLRLYSRGVELGSDPRIEGPVTEGFIKHDIPGRSFRTNQQGLIYEVAELPKVLFPIKTGELTIPAVTLTGDVKVPAQRRSPSVRGFDDFFFDRFTVRSYNLSTDPVTVIVAPLSDEGKPDKFSGSVGSFALEAAARPSRLKVGEPIGVTMKVSGEGNIEAVNAPILSGIEEFKMYEPEVTTTILAKEPVFKGERVFESILVPQHAGRQVIERVAFSYFDPDKERYVTLTEGPFEFEVLPAPVEPTRRAVAVETAPGKSEIKVVGEDIRPIFTELGGSGGAAPIGGVPFAVSVVAPPVAYALFVGTVARRRRLASDVAYARKQRATRDARKRLAAATRAFKRGDGAALCSEVTRAVSGFVADRFAVAAAGLTPADVREKLDSARVPEDLVRRVVDLLEACDYGRFSSSVHEREEMASVLENARRLLSELQRALGRPGARKR
jgi:hypothetical protein